MEMPLTPKEIIKLLLKNGFVHVKNNNGSHQKFYNPKTNTIVIVPVHSRELGKGMEQAILKLAGLRRRDL